MEQSTPSEVTVMTAFLDTARGIVLDVRWTKILRLGDDYKRTHHGTVPWLLYSLLGIFDRRWNARLPAPLSETPRFLVASSPSVKNYVIPRPPQKHEEACYEARSVSSSDNHRR